MAPSQHFAPAFPSRGDLFLAMSVCLSARSSDIFRSHSSFGVSMKQFLVVLAVAGTCTVLSAQEAVEGFTRSGQAAFNLTQASFDNWAAGGDDAVSWQFDVKGKAVKHHDTHSLELKGRLSYGESKLGEDEFRKSSDELNLSARMTFKEDMHVQPYVGISFMTQLADGFVYDDDAGTKTQNSEMLDPAYLIESAGFGVVLQHDVKLKAGLAAKQTFSSEEYGWADDPDTAGEIETLRSEFGIELIAEYERKLNDTANLTTSLRTFYNFGDFREIDTDWDTGITAQVSKAVQMSFNLRILRDADISARRQWKQNLAIGLVYSF